MTTKKAAEILSAKLECSKREYNSDIDCILRNCNDCKLCYDQGKAREQIEALQIAVNALSGLNGIPKRVPEL